MTTLLGACRAGDGCLHSYFLCESKQCKQAKPTCNFVLCCCVQCAASEPWEHYQLRLPSDGGKLAEERAQKLDLHWVYVQLQDRFKLWRATKKAATS